MSDSRDPLTIAREAERDLNSNAAKTGQRSGQSDSGTFHSFSPYIFIVPDERMQSSNPASTKAPHPASAAP